MYEIDYSLAWNLVTIRSADNVIVFSMSITSFLLSAVSAVTVNRWNAYCDNNVIINYNLNILMGITSTCNKPIKGNSSGTASHSYRVSLAICIHTVLPATRHKWTHPALTPAGQAGTRLTYPGGREGWVVLGDWLYTEMVYPPADGHPSKY